MDDDDGWFPLIAWIICVVVAMLALAALASGNCRRDGWQYVPVEPVDTGAVG